jgi:hypothetical protein
MISRRFTWEAADLRLAALPVDAPLDEMIERAAEHFLPVIERGPREVDLPAIRRFENDVAATQVRLYRESLASEAYGSEAPEDVPLGFACECGVSGCADEIELTLAEYEALSAATDRSPLRRPRP